MCIRDRDADKDQNVEEEDEIKLSDAEHLFEEFQNLVKNWKNKEIMQKDSPNKAPHDKEKNSVCFPEEFEKDNDQNFHIDFIYSMANCRAMNYKLDPMDWITVKLKAGRIIPALATTTASIAGLQTIELCKVIKNCRVEDYRNAFLSLAVPILALSEPGPAPITKLTEELKVTIWDRWEIKHSKGRSVSLKEVFTDLQETYKLFPKDVMCGSKAIYFHSIMSLHGKEKEREEMLNKPLVDLIGLDKEDDYVDLTITFSKGESGEILKGTPTIRVYLPAAAIADTNTTEISKQRSLKKNGQRVHISPKCVKLVISSLTTSIFTSNVVNVQRGEAS
eukprot:TRINITY_DN1524_c0_g1_i1.p1 TRINITY_DN1524_c0_g1~~TRINITY_DN1524_c0_g1_i1.p1  ORF type:complete len:350 (-),score=83.41 TRINITY_DN1524_c0_g1_i1:219-1220(-)